MKKLFLGNEGIARGLYEAGCEFVSSYPGTPSTEITEAVAKYKEVYAEWAPNEKVSLESAFGASLSGKRSFCAMKHVGLNVASDPLFTISYSGINAGLVVAVADDPGMHSSQNEQDSRHYAIASKVPMFEPSDSNEAKEFTKLAYKISEEYDCPVMIRMCTRVAHSQSLVELFDREDKEFIPFKKDPKKYIMMPAYARIKHKLVEDRMEKLTQLAETIDINIVEEGKDDSIGIITSSISYQYVKEVCKDKYSILKLGMVNPFPVKKIIDFANKVKKVIIVEELDDIIETHCKKIGIKCVGKEIFSRVGEFSQKVVANGLGVESYTGIKINENIPNRLSVLCAGCPHRGIYYVLKKLNLNVLGDIGCYTLGSIPPLDVLDTTICMGASVSSMHGFTKIVKDNSKKTVSVIGDSTFIHSGITSLINISYNDSKGTVIILDNSTTGMTGHQHNPTTGFNLKGEHATKVNLTELIKSIGIDNVRVIDPYDIEECEKVIKEEVNNDCISVIISRRPCALLKTVKHKKPVIIDENKCIGCKSCIKIGCPAISIISNKAKIDETLCLGCGICKTLCKFFAINESEEV